MIIAGIPFDLVPGLAILPAVRVRQPLLNKAAEAAPVTPQVHQ